MKLPNYSKFSLAMIWISSLTLAQPVLGQSELDELPVVLSASRLKQSPLRAPAGVTVIDRETIIATGARQIVDVLRLVPGVVVQYPRGYWAAVGMRGFGEFFGRNLQVLIDGVSVYNPMWSGVDWSEIPLSPYDIERIEVIRGPNAATYGANAFFGVVNIITRDPSTEPAFQATIASGDRGILDGNLRGSIKGDIWRWRASVGRRSDDGFDERPDSHRLEFASLRGDAQFNGQDSLLFNFSMTEKDAQDGFYHLANDLTSSQRPHDTASHTWTLQTRWARAESVDDEWWVQYYARQTSAWDHIDVKFGPFLLPTDSDYDSRRQGVEAQQTHRFNPDLRAAWGGEWREDNVRSYNYFHTMDWIKTHLWRGFGNVEWKFAPEWTLHPSVMIEDNSMTGRSSASRWAVSWEPIQNHVFRIGTANSRLTPPILHKYANWYYQITPAVKVPVYISSGLVGDAAIRSNEIAYAFEFPSLHLSGDMRWFKERVTGLVRAKGTDLVNSDDANTRGGDLSLNWRPWESTHLRLAVARTIVDSLVDPADRNYGASAPKHTATLHWRQQLPGNYEFSATHYRVGPSTWLEPDQTVPAYGRLDLRLAKKFSLGRERGEVALVTQNANSPTLDFKEKAVVNTYQRRTTFLQLSVEY